MRYTLGGYCENQFDKLLKFYCFSTLLRFLVMHASAFFCLLIMAVFGFLGVLCAHLRFCEVEAIYTLL